MNNEHNPIAVRIGNIQQIYNKSRINNPKARLFNMVCYADDYPLVNGFLKLECSQYGKSNDSFVVFFIDFVDKNSFYYKLIEQWLLTFEDDLKKHPDWNWQDFKTFQEEFKQLKSNNTQELKNFYVKMLMSFKLFETRKDNLLIVGIIIKNSSSLKLLNESLRELFTVLPNDIGILLLETQNKAIHKEMMESIGKLGQTIEIPNQNINKAYKEIATQGNPHDPQVRYRKCLFEIGEAAKDKKQEKVKKLGNELIDISKSTGELSFWASSHLIYASFLFQFKDEKERIHQLLDKGIKMMLPVYKEKQDCAGILMQLYTFKASHYSMTNQLQLAIDYFLKQVAIAKEVNQDMQVINGYNYALMAAKNEDKHQYKDILEEAFQFGYALPDETLKIINFTFIANSYLESYPKIDDKEIKVIANRMETIFGSNWKDNPKQIAKKMQEQLQLANAN
ncbi:hypothetical protein FLBR109950_00150 [Flavobacterium branchiophilum]|uniref:Uncharacterized protein n=1 Tax=Flavobacterium branchiophilum (strain FL-15) TaxID=1034807 RepID=G2Z5L5_FLABF|nr:hypothetical protein [Flavobacterium branchiophilum]CCB70813.1 Protein of unknown function [Flavobacterium branchiophilum FL-15]